MRNNEMHRMDSLDLLNNCSLNADESKTCIFSTMLSSRFAFNDPTLKSDLCIFASIHTSSSTINFINKLIQRLNKTPSETSLHFTYRDEHRITKPNIK